MSPLPSSSSSSSSSPSSSSASASLDSLALARAASSPPEIIDCTVEEEQLAGVKEQEQEVLTGPPAAEHQMLDAPAAGRAIAAAASFSATKAVMTELFVSQPLWLDSEGRQPTAMERLEQTEQREKRRAERQQRLSERRKSWQAGQPQAEERREAAAAAAAAAADAPAFAEAELRRPVSEQEDESEPRRRLRRASAAQEALEAREEKEGGAAGEAAVEYMVDAILDRRESSAAGGAAEYLIQWQGFSSKFATWEPRANLQCDELLRKFERSGRWRLMDELSPGSSDSSGRDSSHRGDRLERDDEKEEQQTAAEDSLSVIAAVEAEEEKTGIASAPVKRKRQEASAQPSKARRDSAAPPAAPAAAMAQESEEAEVLRRQQARRLQREELLQLRQPPPALRRSAPAAAGGGGGGRAQRAAVATQPLSSTAASAAAASSFFSSVSSPSASASSLIVSPSKFRIPKKPTAAPAVAAAAAAAFSPSPATAPRTEVLRETEWSGLDSESEQKKQPMTPAAAASSSSSSAAVPSSSSSSSPPAVSARPAAGDPPPAQRASASSGSSSSSPPVVGQQLLVMGDAGLPLALLLIRHSQQSGSPAATVLCVADADTAPACRLLPQPATRRLLQSGSLAVRGDVNALSLSRCFPPPFSFSAVWLSVENDGQGPLLPTLDPVFDSVREVLAVGGRLHLLLSARLLPDEERTLEQRGASGRQDSTLLSWQGEESLEPILAACPPSDAEATLVRAELSRWQGGCVYVLQCCLSAAEREKERKLVFQQRLTRLQEEAARTREAMRAEERKRGMLQLLPSQPQPQRQQTRSSTAPDPQQAEAMNRARLFRDSRL